MALLASCQGRSATDSPAPTPAGLEVRDAHGTVSARLFPGRPCRAEVEGVALQVGADPLVAMVGAVRWTGAADPASGTLLLRDGAQAARIYPAPPTTTAMELFDAEGVATIRARVDHGEASIVNRSGAVVRTAKKVGAGVVVGDLTVTGTDDVLLAAVLASPEVQPEVRALAACQRLFSLPSSQPKAL